MQQEDAAGPSAEDGLEQHGVDRNLLISLLGGKRRLPTTLHISEPETVTYTVAHEVQVTARNYKAAFASRTPRLAKLAASSGVTSKRGLQVTPRRLGETRPDRMPERIDSVVVHDPARPSATFLSRPRVVQPPVRKDVLRMAVLEGLENYQPRHSPRRPLPAMGTPRLRPIGT